MLRKSRKDKVVDQATSTTTQVKDVVMERVVPAVGHAAEQTREWAGPKVHAAKEWAAPRAQKGLDAAAPRVEHAVEAVSPKIDAARDKLVEDVLPKLVEAITAATTQASAVREEATARSSDAVAVLKGEAVAKPKKKHRVRKFLLFSAVVGGAAAAVKAMRGKKEDPWATPAGTTSWAPATPAPSSTGSSMATDLSAPVTAAAAEESGLEEAAASEATLAGAEATDAGAGDATETSPEGGGGPASKSTSARARKTAKANQASEPVEHAEPTEPTELGGEG